MSAESINHLSLYFVSARNWVWVQVACVAGVERVGGRGLRQAPLSYSQARELFRQMISELCLDSHEFGSHSLRSGGASQAARSGVSGRVWRRHGGWRSIHAADGYMSLNLWRIPLWYLQIWHFNFQYVICLINIARVVLYAAVYRDLHLPT